ncbi:uncharacterized protein LOC116845318 isoform X2 [Odontomachus brunneus]|uniref:uncharacterized protein LOC116845318 isoform X2 n=1 Tax=Odontomachus brunneus TaxID=486640 RepID=UPI0013F1866F|nr:uncharacterized protein LOC116845318 isoform X2 [Odontomachus brunneus]
MNYSGNMPDWHQYNPPQSGINDVTTTAQNVNSGHLPFISSINPPTQLNHGLNLNTEGHEKHQNDSTFNARHFQPHLSSNISHGHNAADSNPIASMVQMQNCIGHYGPSNTRNPIVDNLNGPMDPRNTAIGGLNDELGYRNNQVPLNGPISHLNGPNVMSMNTPHGSIGPRNANVNSHASSRAGPSFVSCKGLCCNPDPNISYQQWEKYCSYQSNTTYRDNIRASGYQTDTRRFGNDFNFRKDNFDGKEVLPPNIVPSAPNADHRRNYPDYKYRKDRLFPRSYPPSSGMLQNYPMQNYNYTGEYQKYPYNAKEYSKVNNMSIPSQGMVKHQEQSFMAQQKYNKQQQQQQQQQVPYQNNAMMSSSMPSTNVNPSMMPSTQNTYFNPQYPQNLSTTETAHDCQEVADNASMVNRMQMSTMHPPLYSRFQTYQHKIAMQRFSMENQLKELARIPGYQTHPRYKECLLKYKELLKMQQSVTYQGQIQQTPCVTTSTVNTSVPPINLQFDQNGVLINSNYMPEAFPRVQQVLNPQAPADSSDKQNKQESNGVPNMGSHSVQKPEQLMPQQPQHDVHAPVLCPNTLQKQEQRYPVQKNLEPNVQFEVQQKTASESFNNLNSGTSDTAIQQKISKEFADKPELDVRQFLANWDESEDEDGTSSNMQNVVLSNSTPVVVVGYENVDLSAKTLVSLEGSKPEKIPSGVIAFENQDKSDANVVPAQDCLTISYSSAKNVEITKDTCKEIAKDGIVQPGSIIQCISNGPDEVPTIHIVDNLEIGSILQVTSGQVSETLERQETVSFFHESTEVEASAITLETDKFKKSDNGGEASGESTTTIEYNADLGNLSKDKYVVESSSPPKTAESTSQMSQVSDDHQEELTTLATPAKDNLDTTQGINLKKQSSFTSEESHNPDDISLPDLPTSECTPISTTLNTPIHSDSEESSERVQDLTISTNPIEVVQNSPIISFTQSPMRGEPYDHLSDDADGVKSKSADSLESQYQANNGFNDDGNNNMPNHDNVLNTFEFPTNKYDKNGSTMTMKRNNKERAGSSGSNASVDDEKTFPLSAGTANATMTGMCMTLTSGDYELKITSTGMQSKTTRDDKNSTVGRRASESQAAANVSDDAQETRKKLRTLSETGVKAALRYDDSAELDEALQNIATSNSAPVGERDDAPARDDVNYADAYEARLLKPAKSEDKSCVTLSASKRKCISTESAHQTITASSSTIDLSLAGDATSRGSRPPAAEDSCSTKIVKSNLSTSHSTKHPTTLDNDKLGKNEASARGDFSAERSGNKLLKVDTRDSRRSRHVSRHPDRKSTSSNRVDSHDKKGSSENTVEKCNEAIIHHNKHTQEANRHKAKSCAVKDLKECDVSRNESKRTTGNNVDENRERLRLLKEYRRIKYKSPSVAEASSKSKDTQEVSDYRASKKCHSAANPDERSVAQLLNDKQLCQKDASFKSLEEQEKKQAVLKTFVSKNSNSDFAIQVTNVNLKLKDNDHQKELQYLGEEAKNSGSLDAIKIEINVSCSERNTKEKLLHENIKNAVAETIGHLTSSISSGTRSGSTNLMEIQCDKKIVYDQAADSRGYERHDRSPIALTESPYDDLVHKSDQDSVKALKYKSANATCKEDTTNDEASSSLGPKMRRSISSEQEVTNNVYEVKGNVNVETEPAASASETPKSEHVLIRRRSVHQDTERKVITTNFPMTTEESKTSADNSSHTGSTSKNSNTQKKEHQEATTAFLCKNARNSQDSVVSKLNAGASTSSSTADLDLESVGYDNNSAHFDYNHFDIAANENADADDKRMDRWKRPRRDDSRFNSLDLYETASGYMNPIFFSVDELENLNSVPVYSTKDGKITYSPNPRFTYYELLMEARAKEGYGNTRDSYFARSPSFDYYNCSKLRKVFKKSREVAAALRKREVDLNTVDTKQQFTTKHADYLPSKNAHHVKARNTLHLEFFNDDADKLYMSRNDQESKEGSTKNIVDVNLLEKQCKAGETVPDGEPASNIKHCKTKDENLDYEKGYNESSVFDPNKFLEPRTLWEGRWEETMESVKSYSSHVDRRNSGNLKELNFSEIFVKQERLDSSLPFLHTKQESLDGNGDHNASNNCDTANEPPTLAPTTCSHTSDDLRLVRDDDSLYEQSKLRAVACDEQEDTNNNQNVVLSTTEVNNKQQVNKSLSVEHDASLHDEYTKKQHSQFDEVETAAIVFAKEAPSCAPEVVDNEVCVLGTDQGPVSHVQETFTESLVADDLLVPLNEDKLSVEDTAAKEIPDKNSTEVTSPSKSNVNCDYPLDKPKCTETVEEVPILAADEQTDEINDSAKNNSDFIADDEVVHKEALKSTPADREEEEEKPKEVPQNQTATESNVTDEIYFNDETNERNNSHDKENFTLCGEEELITSRNPLDVVMAVSRPLDEESVEQKSQKLQDNEQLPENSSKDPGIDEVDCCSSTVLFESTTTLDLHSVRPEENVCDIFASEMREQNISEFTVIKTIIKADKRQYEESETRETTKDNDSIMDTKLLCMDSSDCVIYPEDRCVLMQISEHDFTEDDSMVLMEWETSQIQEDAVNRLCGINESSIDFAAAANSLRSEDNSLLDNLSLSRPVMKESQLLELPSELENKLDESAVLDETTALPPPPMLEKFKVTPCDHENREQKEQNPVSSSSYENVAYLRATDCNANTKIIPKLVIKKTDVSSKFVTKMSPSSFTDNVANKSVSRPSCHPKIPKMIIRNVKSRPDTPSIEAVPDKTLVQVSISERALITKHETREDLYENDSESSLQDPGSSRNKIPKMKIKLDVSKIVRDENTAELCVKRKSMKKTIPKESRNLERHEEKIPILKLRKQERNRSSSPEMLRKRQSSSHSDVPTKRYKRSGCDDIMGHSTRRSNSDSARTTTAKCEMKRDSMIGISEKIPKVIIKRTSASAEFKCELSKSGKNVIAKSSKWQPKVKLERYRILDSMAKDLKSSSSLTPVSLRIIDKIFVSRKDNWRRREHDHHDCHKLSRSNSTSDLLPVKCKQRRMSDYDCRKINGASKDDLRRTSSRDADSKDTKTRTTPKKNTPTKDHGRSTDNYHKDDKRRSRSRDNNLRTEAKVIPSEKETIKKDKSAVKISSFKKVISQCNKCKIDGCDVKLEKVMKTEEDTSSSVKLDRKNPPKHSSSMDFKTALKELKATSEMENCSMKLFNLSEISSEEIEPQEDKEQSKKDDPFLCKDDDKVTIKEQLNPDYMDIECTLQDDVISLKEEPILSDIKMDNNAVIKIESSDESQTTIEILPASPDDSHSELESHIIDDGESEQLYSADAIPTQFELELEIADNSDLDLLDMPRLNPVACYNARRTSAEEYYGNPTSKAGLYDRPEPLHCNKNPLEKDKYVEINVKSDDRPVSESMKSIGCVEETPSKFPCSKGTDSQSLSREKFCCNDSLVKEVLAAKETLKKCLSKSRCENSPKPKTAAEKKQGSSFDLNSLSETYPKSSDASESCHGDVTLQTGSIPAASKHNNKTESIANAKKSDKKHSKPSKSVLAKKKIKPPDKRDEELRPTLTRMNFKEIREDAHECTTISLKTYKRLGQVAVSHENSSCVVNLSEKKKKNPGDQKDTVPQSPQDTPRKEGNKILSYKIPKISRSVDQGSNASGKAKRIKSKEDNMPTLEPAVIANFDTGLDRDSSRSPPVITNQDSADVDVTASKLLDNDKVITLDNKVDMKDVHKKSEMSIADFVSQLAYHEKATIKHRRYCNLCERWFPTTSRHRRHLAGYQHRHIELTQRRSIHTLFMLFTGKPCPRLMPANVVRNDCSVGELTPLQIAVQDVTKSFDHTEQSPKKQNDVDK